MDTKQRLLTKSRFKMALECPTKLFYTGKDKYPNKKLEDPFLIALAEGGFQIGELAKIIHSQGVEINDIDSQTAYEKTMQLMQEENITLFEAAIKFENLLIRADIIIKKNDTIELIEVKSKSINGNNPNVFFNKNGSISSEWKPYLFDIAFQHYVCQQAFPNYKIVPYLMLANKDETAKIDGINQLFRIKKNENGRIFCSTAEKLPPIDDLSNILCKINIQPTLDIIHNDKSFQSISYFAQMYQDDKKIQPILSSKCKSCEFQCSNEDEINNKINGFKECWSETLNWTNKEFELPSVLDIWSLAGKDKLMSQGKYLMHQLNSSDILPKKKEADISNGLSAPERRWTQLQKAINNDNSPYIDKDGLAEEMNSWTYPLHFIDFETSAVAIPFNQGLRPYEGIAFQFSHHIINSNGMIEHKDQYLNCKKGIFPNFDFVRELKKALDKDSGTIFRYATHENTYLCLIYQQLMEKDLQEVPDRDELCNWIKTITTPTQKLEDLWVEGPRNMIDLCELVKKYYYHPLSKGSNSIKKVLPAILNESKFLQEKYSQNTYGAPNGIRSLNFKNMKWIELDNNGNVKDPYKLLPTLFENNDLELMDLISSNNTLADGGAAMTAYAKMQFSEISEFEHAKLSKALLKYCELDTLAMVLIFEYWNNIIFSKKLKITA